MFLDMAHQARDLLSAPFRAQDVSLVKKSFQERVVEWALHTFGRRILDDRKERAHRFGEEAIELLQAAGVTKSEVLQLVDYVYGRPIGELPQEVGGTIVCLAALCETFGLKLIDCGETELARCWTLVDKIRAKHAAKPKFSPLPGVV